MCHHFELFDLIIGNETRSLPERYFPSIFDLEKKMKSVFNYKTYMMKVLSPFAEGYIFVLLINKQLRIFDMNFLCVPGFVKLNPMSLEKFRVKNCIQQTVIRRTQ